MRQVNIQYHAVAKATEDVPFQLEELKSLFASSGIELNLVKGEALCSEDYLRFVDQFRRTSPNCGHLIIGGNNRNSDAFINGELLDRGSRGVAVIYTNSSDIVMNGESAFLQTCSHEIGHMLNLAHHDVAHSYTSVMDQAGKRSSDVSLSWNLAEAEANDMNARGEPSYFSKSLPVKFCYPFAWKARYHLNEYSDDQLLPWKSKFDYPYEGSQDKWYHDLNLRIELEHKRHIVGGTLAFIVRFRNNGPRSRFIPARIGTEFDTLIVTVTRPDGQRYRHLSRTLACSFRRRLLKPGEEIIRPFCTMRGPGGAVFTVHGRYIVSAVFPQGQAEATPIEVNVEPRSDGPLANQQFRRFISQGASRRSPRFLRHLDEALATGLHLDPASRGYLALIRATTEQDPVRTKALHKLALADSSTTAVRHAAVVERTKTMAREGALNRSSWDRLKNRYLQQDKDQYLVKQLEEFHSW